MVSPTVLEARASNAGPVNGSIHTSDSEQCTKHAGETLTSQKASGDREHVRVEGRWAPLHPNLVEYGSKNHGDGEVSLRNDEALDRPMEK